MKTLIKAIAMASLASTAAVAQADITGTLGVNSSYQLYGQELDGSSTAYAGIGFDLSGFNVGITVIDADEAGFTETDTMLGYTMNLMGADVRLSYLDRSFDYGVDDYDVTEFSVGITASGLSIDYVNGNDDINDIDADFSIISLGYTVSNVDIVVGTWDYSDGGPEYSFYEISTGTEIFGLDASVTLTSTFSEDGYFDEQGSTIVIGMSKSLDL
jgi:hypothetical protein